MDAFGTLGIPKDSSKERILKAWRLKMRLAHPDKNGGSEEKAKALNQARDEAMDSIGYKQGADGRWSQTLNDYQMDRMKQLFEIVSRKNVDNNGKSKRKRSASKMDESFEEFMKGCDGIMGRAPRHMWR